VSDSMSVRVSDVDNVTKQTKHADGYNTDPKSFVWIRT
jgi:hypothetical protein